MNKKNNKKFTNLYFDKELVKLMDEMTQQEMEETLKELTDTKYWVAISRYVQDRLMVANGSLAVIDPMKEPTSIARAQGIMSGLMDLQDMTNKIKESIKTAEKAANAKIEISEDKLPEYGEGPMY
jgi:hypothetical protein